MTVSAADAGKAMSVIANTLLNHDVIQPEGFHTLSGLATKLQKKKTAIAWSVEVDRGSPILFRRTKDERSQWVKPRIVAKGIDVEQGDGTILPFRALDSRP